MWCRISKIAFWLFLLFLAVSACKEQPQIEKKTVAKIGDVKLTDYDLDLMLGSNKYSRKHRMEFIKDWVEKEMLYREAISNNLVDDEEFKLAMKNSEKELAAARQLEYYIDGDDENFSSGELEDYFDQFKNDFRLESDAFLLNRARFYDRTGAINFRGAALENGWNDAVDEYQKSIESHSEETFLTDFQLEPIQLLRTVKALFLNEFSIVLEIRPRLFEVVQLIRRFKKGEVPDFKFVRNKAAIRYKIKRRHDLLKEYIAKLYSKYDVVINGEN